jgi:acyl-CoA dehydrogenase
MTLDELKRPGATARRTSRAKAASADLMARTRRVAAAAAQFADDVDRAGRFPAEAIAAAKAEGLMGVMAPKSLGGEDASLSELSDICYTLGQACASTAMIYAMHQVQIACVVRHGMDSAWIRAFLRLLTN